MVVLPPGVSYLPRKFKFAVIASDEDRAAMRLHDIGIQLVRRDGRLGARVFVGGGMGRTPMIGPEINEFVAADEILSYLEACLRVYNRYGRRDNIYKARIKILVHEIGADEYRRQVAEEWEAVRALGIDPPVSELERITAFFAPPAWADGGRGRPVGPRLCRVGRAQHAAPQARRPRARHHQPEAGGRHPGDASAEQMEVVADLAERFSHDELRVTHAQNLVLPHVRRGDLRAVWDALTACGLATANRDLVTDIIACPGLDYCSLANARSIPVAQRIAERMDARAADVGELKVKISGCINACGHHHAGHIGILGVDRKGVENYQLSLGGSGAEDVSLAKITGPGFDEAGIVDAVETVTELYLSRREGDERFLDTYRRLGMEPFKEALYG